MALLVRRRVRAEGRPAGWCVVGVLIATVITGCGSSGPVEPAAGAPPSPARAPRALTDTETRLLNRAETVLVGRCMRRQGFAYWAGEPARAGEGAGPFPYVLDDVARARREGYGSPVTPTSGPPDPNERYVAGLDERGQRAYITALYGTRSPDHRLTVTLDGGVTLHASRDGCTADAERSLYRDLALWFGASRTVDNLRVVVEAKVRGDSRFTAAQAAWADCMGDRHHPYPSVGALREDLGRRTPGESGRAAVTALAVAEASCARSSGFAEVARRLDASYTAQVRSAKADTIDALRRLQLDALPRARAVVSGASPSEG
jgi:hypothetical protein